LTCNRVNSLNNDDNDDMAISISENFYVTKSGGAGGSGVNFNGGFGGTFKGIGNFTQINNLGDPGTIDGSFIIEGSEASVSLTGILGLIEDLSGKIDGVAYALSQLESSYGSHVHTFSFDKNHFDHSHGISASGTTTM
jgi:hypothetical protein